MWCYVLITWYKVLLYILHKFEQEFLLNSLYPQNKTQMQRTVIIFVIMGRITYTQTALHLIHQLPICAPNSTVSAQGQVFNVMHIHESWSFCTGVLVSSQDQACFPGSLLRFLIWSWGCSQWDLDVFSLSPILQHHFSTWFSFHPSDLTIHAAHCDAPSLIVAIHFLIDYSLFHNCQPQDSSVVSADKSL